MKSKAPNTITGSGLERAVVTVSSHLPLDDFELGWVVATFGAILVSHIIAQTVRIVMSEDSSTNTPLLTRPAFFCPLASHFHVGLSRFHFCSGIDRRPLLGRLGFSGPPLPTRDVRRAPLIESVSDRVRETERNEFAKHLLAVAAEADAVEEILLARHHVCDLERAHDPAEGIGVHGPNIAGVQIELDVLNKLIGIADLVEDLVVAILADEVVREVNNVLSHFYLLSRDFPPPEWIAIPRHSVSCDMSQR